MNSAIRLVLAVLMVWLLVGPLDAAAAEPRRVALVIGNGAYQHIPPLANPANDARMIGEVLRRLAFEMVGGGPQLDLDRAGMERAIHDFSGRLGPGTVAVLFYAGHGVQIRGANYLIPVNALVKSASDVDFDLVGVGAVLRQMELRESALNVVILDASRDNPFADRLLTDGGAGLAQLRSPRGTVIAFATQPGDVAFDGRGRDSPFSIALAEEMPKPNVPLLDMFNNVAVDVSASTNHMQLPWISSSAVDRTFSLGGDLGRFAGKPPVSGRAPASQSAPGTPTAEAVRSPAPVIQPSAALPASAELLLWQKVQYSRNPADIEEYLRQFPTGAFSGLARLRVSELTKMSAGRPLSATTGPGCPGGAAAQPFPEFRWPPAASSGQFVLPDSVFRDTVTSLPTLGAVGERIARGLRQAGYADYGFYHVPNGFVVVGPLERIDPGGKTVSGFRESAADAAGLFAAAGSIPVPSRVPEGRYRLIAFVVTDQPLVTSGRPMAPVAGNQLTRCGDDPLPEPLRGRAFSPAYAVTALVYEYRQGGGGGAISAIRPGGLSAEEHLRRSGIEAFLLPPR